MTLSPARRRAWVVSVIVGAMGLSVLGVTAASMIKSPAQAAAEAGPPARDILTARVEHRVIKETVVVRGRVEAGQTIDVAPTGAGGEGVEKAVVTKLPLARGGKVGAGQLLAEISGRPVFALKGKLPVYRDLKPGSEGEDVAQLQQALAALGHGTGADREGIFGEGTKAALNGFYESIGYEPLPAKPDGAENEKAARGAVRQAERAWQDAPEGKDRERAAEDLQDARAELAKVRAGNGPVLPASEVVFLNGFPARVETLSARVGTVLSGRVMTLSAGELMVEGSLAPNEKGLVRAGQEVGILADVAGTETTGKVVSVSEAEVEAGDGNGEGGEEEPQGDTYAPTDFTMLVKPSEKLTSRWAGQDVRLTIEAASSRGKVLVVPVSAVSAGVDSRTTVTVLEAGDRRRRVEVRIGVEGDGHVEVTPVGGTLEDGEKVIIGVKKGNGS